MIRAKFKVTKKVIHENGYQEVFLGAVFSSDPEHENKKFWDATPSGTINMNISKNGDLFVIGKEYYVDFTLAE